MVFMVGVFEENGVRIVIIMRLLIGLLVFEFGVDLDVWFDGFGVDCDDFVIHL